MANGVRQSYIRGGCARDRPKWRTRSTLTKDLAQAWKDAFNTELNRLELNGRQRIFVVIEGEDERMVSLVRFLRASGVDITLLKYNFYRTASDEELLDFEKEVGEEDTGAQPTKAAPPSEEGLVQQWSLGAQQSYSRIRDKFTAAGLFGRAKKTGMSFSKQTRTGPSLRLLRYFVLWQRELLAALRHTCRQI